jgi:hypothetical protein
VLVAVLLASIGLKVAGIMTMIAFSLLRWAWVSTRGAEALHPDGI